METEPEAIKELEARLYGDYRAPGRFYHDVSHLEDCLRQLQGIAGLSVRERRLLHHAILWHDSIYDPRRGDNEERSAERAERELRAAGSDPEDAAEVARLVLLTKGHRVAAADRLGALLVSIDLSILGAALPRYRAYAAAIRREYAHVPDDAFRAGRRAVLVSLLAADPLYPDPDFRARYEAQARANMAEELADLE